MDKYGVDEGLDNEKTAGTETPKVCPDCGAPLEDTAQTGVLYCPNCGTEPFERS